MTRFVSYNENVMLCNHSITCRCTVWCLRYMTIKYLQILSWNIKGLKETIDGLRINKLVEPEVTRRLERYDIIFLQETHQDDSCETTVPRFSSAISFRRQKRGRSHKASGGILVLIKESLRESVKCLPCSSSDICLAPNQNGRNARDTIHRQCIHSPRKLHIWHRPYRGYLG